MMRALPWLPEPPEDLKEQLKALSEATDAIGSELRFLASYRLNDSQLNKLAKVLRALKESGADLSPLTSFKLGVTGNVTTELFTPLLRASSLRYGVDLDIYEAEFDQTAQESLNADSGLNNAGCEAVFFAIDFRNLPFALRPGDADGEKSIVESVFNSLMRFREGILQQNSCLFIFQTLVPPVENIFGNHERQISGTMRSMFARFNAMLFEHAGNTGDLVFDAAQLAETIGLENWHDPVSWHMGKLAFAPSLAPLYTDHLARVIATTKGKSRRVLVLDLDNTLWGGVIGDDGMEGISIGQGSALGESYLAIQKTALDLRQRGIVLAVCSKNDDEAARRPFREHPEMLLKEEHISVFQANWDDKATNIQAIADHLSLGLDSFVFLDDNPAERARVRQMLPDVAVPELPDDPALYPRALLTSGYFDTVCFSEEDKKRAEYYNGNAQRLQLQENLGDYDEYLKSLEMTVKFQPFDDLGRMRITQLINKTNQFNLTTIRHPETRVAEMQNDPCFFTLQVRLEDRFGDNGMISVVICREEEDRWDIVTWLMSCRVLKRKAEESVLAELVSHARERGIKRLTGSYIPTAKNTLVREHYANLGFTKTGGKDGGETEWELDPDTYKAQDLPLNIERSGFDAPNEKIAVNK